MPKANPSYLALNLSAPSKDFSPHLLRIYTPSFMTGDIFIVPGIHVCIITSTLCHREQVATSTLLTTICPGPVLKKYSDICRENKGIKSVLSHLLKNTSMNSQFPSCGFFSFSQANLFQELYVIFTIFHFHTSH